MFVYVVLSARISCCCGPVARGVEGSTYDCAGGLNARYVRTRLQCVRSLRSLGSKSAQVEEEFTSSGASTNYVSFGVNNLSSFDFWIVASAMFL